jgi:hypothetical protein
MRADIACELMWSLVRAPRNAKPTPESASMFLEFLTQMLGELVICLIVIPIVLSRACVQSMWERRREEHAWIKRALDALDIPGVKNSKSTLASVSERQTFIDSTRYLIRIAQSPSHMHPAEG